MNQTNPKARPATIVIFGASGDLTQRKLVPALHSLACDGLLHPQTHVVGVARSYDDPDTYRRLGERLARLGGNRLFYLATPPTLYPVAIEALGRAGLNRGDHRWTRIIVEKPFGRDFESAQRLNQQVHAVFDENQVYRIDHYLGKETVQNILTFRFANAIFDPARA